MSLNWDAPMSPYFGGAVPNLLNGIIDRLVTHRFSRYVVAGALSNLASYSLFVLLYTFVFRPHVVPAYMLASVGAMPLSFRLNRSWVFRSRADLRQELTRFGLVYGVSIVAGLLVLQVLLRVVPAPVVVVQALASVALVICFFLAHTLWTFAHQSR